MIFMPGMFPEGGSSPLARGLRSCRAFWKSGEGIIPACAGFTRANTLKNCISQGSSPLARGLPSIDVRFFEKTRIIPACAGFTRTAFSGCGTARDHPRLRGVYGLGGGEPEPVFGSSPLARGLLSSFLDTGRSFGIIPACAGFTIMVGEESMRARDHPRLRGVYRGWRVDGWRVPGSSPLARGLPPASSSSRRGRGIIPACAGFTDL